MTDTYLTLAQLNALFQLLTQTMLGIDPALEASAYAVRVAWPTGGAPAWKITEDVAFIRIVEDDDPYNRQRDVENFYLDDVTVNQATNYTRVNGVTWTFYGPNSYDNAQKVRDRIFYQANHDTLESNNIFLIPDIVSPRRMPELFQGQWWERTDLTMSFNELIIRNLTASVITSVPISVTDEAGHVDSQVIS